MTASAKSIKHYFNIDNTTKKSILNKNATTKEIVIIRKSNIKISTSNFTGRALPKLKPALTSRIFELKEESITKADQL